jgi:hypothetical protein
MESKIARDKRILFYYYFSQMQKQQFVMKGLFFGLFGIVIFSGSVFAQDVGGYGMQNNTDCITKETDACYSSYPSPEDKSKQDLCLLSAASKCPTTEEPKTNVAQCILECKNDPDCATKCQCTKDETYDTTTKKCVAKPTADVDPADQTVMGITMGPKCLKNGQCGFDIYKLLGINKSSSATLFVQDILLSATFFIGTVITIALIYSGIMFIMAGATGKDPSKAKNGITYSIIGLLLVISSYTIIRLVQYIAKGL